MSDDVVERFSPTSGKVLGIVALVLVAAVVVIGLVDREHGFPLPVVAGALVFGVLVWSSMLRPRVWATGEALVLRNMLEEISIPLAAIEQVVVRQVLAVQAGDKRFVSPAIGKSWRKLIKSNRAKPGDEAQVNASYPVFVEERISKLAEEARTKAGVQLLSDEQLALAAGVRRRWAWPEVGGLVASVLLFAFALLT